MTARALVVVYVSGILTLVVLGVIAYVVLVMRQMGDR